MVAGSTCPPAPTGAPWPTPNPSSKASSGPDPAPPGRPLYSAGMRLTIIGCSGSFPGPESPASSYLLEAEGFRLLLDLGSGALGVLQRHADLYSIDAVALSHLHPDHCLDMCGYWVARRYAPGGPSPRSRSTPPIAPPNGSPWPTASNPS